MSRISTTNYSVCHDCLLVIAYGDSDSAEEGHEDAFDRGVKRETKNLNEGSHFVSGVAPTDEDPDGQGYEEFSNSQCEICGTHLAGSRHGATLVEPLPPHTFRKLSVTWTVDIEVPIETTDVEVARQVAQQYFQERIANGEPDTACNFELFEEDPDSGEQIKHVKVDLAAQEPEA